MKQGSAITSCVHLVMSVVSVIVVIVHVDGHLLDGGDGHLDLLDDGDVVLHRVLLHDGYIHGLVHGVGRGHDQGHLVHDVLAGSGAEAATGAALVSAAMSAVVAGVRVGEGGHGSGQECQHKRVHDCERGRIEQMCRRRTPATTADMAADTDMAADMATD